MQYNSRTVELYIYVCDFLLPRFAFFPFCGDLALNFFFISVTTRGLYSRGTVYRYIGNFYGCASFLRFQVVRIFSLAAGQPVLDKICILYGILKTTSPRIEILRNHTADTPSGFKNYPSHIGSSNVSLTYSSPSLSLFRVASDPSVRSQTTTRRTSTRRLFSLPLSLMQPFSQRAVNLRARAGMRARDIEFC